MEMTQAMGAASAAPSPLHIILLIVFSLIALSYVARLTFLRGAIKAASGHFNGPNEAAHLLCCLLMIPMVVESLMGSPGARNVGALLALGGALFFLFRWSRTHIIHFGMFLGMAVMYYAEGRVIVSAGFTSAIFWLFALFYFLFSLNYALKLFLLRKEQNQPKRWFMLQSEVAHVVIGLAMLGMYLWPTTFMALAK